MSVSYDTIYADDNVQWYLDQISFETFESLVSGITLELEQINEQLAALTKSARSAGGEKKRGKKGGKKVNFRNDAGDRDNDDESSSSYASKWLGIGQQMGMFVVAGAIEYRAVFLFGIASAAIAIYGDIASV